MCLNLGAPCMKDENHVEYTPEQLQEMYPQIDWKRLGLALLACAVVMVIAAFFV